LLVEELVEVIFVVVVAVLVATEIHLYQKILEEERLLKLHFFQPQVLTTQ